MERYRQVFGIFLSIRIALSPTGYDISGCGMQIANNMLPGHGGPAGFGASPRSFCIPE